MGLIVLGYVDQMVFYAAKGIGYTVIAKSSGITEVEETSFRGKALPTEYHILKGISIENLRKGEGGGFFRVYRLPSGRIAVSHVVYKGRDEYGRQLMNAHALVFSENLYRQLSANPYSFVEFFTHPVEKGMLPQLAYSDIKPRLREVSYPDRINKNHIVLVDLLLEAATGKRVLLILDNNDPIDRLVAESLSLLPSTVRSSICLYSFASDPEKAKEFNFVIVPRAVEVSAFVAEGIKMRLSKEYTPAHAYSKNLEQISVSAHVSEFMEFVENYLHEKDIGRLNNLSEYFVYLKEYAKIPPSHIDVKLHALNNLKTYAEKLGLEGEIEKIENSFVTLLIHAPRIPDNLYQNVVTVVKKREDASLANKVVGKFESRDLNVDFLLEFHEMLERNVILGLISSLDLENIHRIVSFFKQRDKSLVEDILRTYGDESLIYSYIVECLDKNMDFSYDLIYFIKKDEYKEQIFNKLLDRQNLQLARQIAGLVSEPRKTKLIKKVALKYYEIGRKHRDMFMLREAVKLAKESSDQTFIKEIALISLNDEIKIITEELIDLILDKDKCELFELAIKKDYPDLVYRVFKDLMGKYDDALLENATDYIVSKIKKLEVDNYILRLIQLINVESLLYRIAETALKKNQLEIAVKITERLPDRQLKDKLMEKYYEIGKKNKDVEFLEKALKLSRELKKEEEELKILEEVWKLKKLKPLNLYRYLMLENIYGKKILKILKQLIESGNEHYLHVSLGFIEKNIDKMKIDKKLLKTIVESFEKMLKLKNVVKNKKDRLELVINELRKHYPRLTEKILKTIKI